MCPSSIFSFLQRRLGGKPIEWFSNCGVVRGVSWQSHKLKLANWQIFFFKYHIYTAVKCTPGVETTNKQAIDHCTHLWHKNLTLDQYDTKIKLKFVSYLSR